MKISVLTPSFNSGNTIQKAIDSVKNQSYKYWEHIIVDGNSTDCTLEILKQNTHINWISEQDEGQSDAMNKAFKMSTGDLIVYLNADDYFYHEAFKTIVNTFSNNPDIDIVVSNIDCLYQGKLQTHSNATLSWKDLSVIEGRFPLNPLSYFYKRKVQQKIGNFPLKEHFTMDYWFLLRAFYFFKPFKIEQVLGVFVYTEFNKSSTIPGEYQVQMPHALKFCLRYTPWRLFFVSFKLITHPKKTTRFADKIKKIYSKLMHKLKFVFK